MFDSIPFTTATFSIIPVASSFTFTVNFTSCIKSLFLFNSSSHLKPTVVPSSLFTSVPLFSTDNKVVCSGIISFTDTYLISFSADTFIVYVRSSPCSTWLLSASTDFSTSILLLSFTLKSGFTIAFISCLVQLKYFPSVPYSSCSIVTSSTTVSRILFVFCVLLLLLLLLFVFVFVLVFDVSVPLLFVIAVDVCVLLFVFVSVLVLLLLSTDVVSLLLFSILFSVVVPGSFCVVVLSTCDELSDAVVAACELSSPFVNKYAPTPATANNATSTKLIIIVFLAL